MKTPIPLTDDKITITVPVRTNVAVHKAISKPRKVKEAAR